jgi:1,4-dihydroxy-2-naphthoate polyprenyltransferase
MKIKSWISAFRLRTLPLSLSGIILGSIIARENGFWDNSIFAFALLTTLFFQILSNLANDLGDSQKGTDNEHRVGPMRAVQSGEISQKEMKIAVVIFSFLSLFSASYLIKLSAVGMNQEMITMYGILAILSILSAITYTIGKRAYGYNGFGDIFVFIFFGLVSVLGSYTLYTKHFNWEVMFPAITIGLLSTAVLNLNNMRDRINDANAGKVTVVVKLGKEKAKKYHLFLVIAAILSLIFTISHFGVLQYIFLLPVGFLAAHLKRVLATQVEKDFDPELKKVALTTFGISILYLIISIIRVNL